MTHQKRQNWSLTNLCIITLLLSFLTDLTACGKINPARPADQTSAVSPQIPISPGTYPISIQVGQDTRWFTLIIPPHYDHTEPRPLLFFFHGGNLSMGFGVNNLPELIQRSAEENWLLVFMNGSNLTDNRGAATWNAIHCCFPSLGRFDDLGFVRTTFDALSVALKVDAGRVYAMGGSNGAMFTHCLAAEMSDVFTAAAENAGTIGGQEDESSPVVTIQPAQPFPIMLTHGMNDMKVNFNGGKTAEGDRIDISFKESVEFWARNNQCDLSQQETSELDGLNGKIWIVTFTSCASNAQVSAIRFEKFGHGWPSLETVGFDTANAMVDFLLQFSK